MRNASAGGICGDGYIRSADMVDLRSVDVASSVQVEEGHCSYLILRGAEGEVYT